MTAEWGIRQVGDDYVEIRKDEAEARKLAAGFDRAAEAVDDPMRHEVVRREWVKA